LSYNRDLQEDKEPLFDAVDTVKASLACMSGMLATMRIKRERMEAAAEGGFAMATDMAEYLVLKGVPFREAHRIVGMIVADCIACGKELSDMTLEEYRKYYKGFDSDVLEILSARASISRKKTYGSTAAQEVERRLAEFEEKNK
ncbi:MAG: argininosuccinate lyase, partial [Syntrophales bacterium]|nr:argininosuccinate lyase [Syntrophales bacterium]